MEIIAKGIRDPFNKSYVNIDKSTGETQIKQDSGLKIRAKNDNSEIGITDNNFCVLLEDDGSVTKVTFNPQNKKEVIFVAYYKDGDGKAHKKEEKPYATVNVADQEIKN